MEKMKEKKRGGKESGVGKRSTIIKNKKTKNIMMIMKNKNEKQQ